MTPKCKDCAELKWAKVKGPWYRCAAGHFDTLPAPAAIDQTPIPTYYAWSGIARPNKAVAEAQDKCLDFRGK